MYNKSELIVHQFLHNVISNHIVHIHCIKSHLTGQYIYFCNNTVVKYFSKIIISYYLFPVKHLFCNNNVTKDYNIKQNSSVSILR